MHEAGLAAAIVAEIRDRQLDAMGLRLVVHGGHDGEAFEGALREHLALVLPPAVVASMEITHEATPRLCATCVQVFEGGLEGAECPSCGGPGLPVAVDAWVEIDLDGEPVDKVPDADESRCPGGDDERPSPHHRSPPHAEAVSPAPLSLPNDPRGA